jgi:hypothetical protein
LGACYRNGDQTHSRGDAVLAGSEQADRSPHPPSPDVCGVNAIARRLVTASLQCHVSNHADVVDGTIVFAARALDNRLSLMGDNAIAGGNTSGSCSSTGGSVEDRRSMVLSTTRGCLWCQNLVATARATPAAEARCL